MQQTFNNSKKNKMDFQFGFETVHAWIWSEIVACQLNLFVIFSFVQPHKFFSGLVNMKYINIDVLLTSHRKRPSHVICVIEIIVWSVQIYGKQFESRAMREAKYAKF